MFINLTENSIFKHARVSLFRTDQKILTRTFNLLSTNKAAEFILRTEYTRNNQRSVQSAVAGATMALSARINFQNYVGIISRGLITL